MVPADVLRDELPDVEVLAKLESVNPGGSLKDRPVLRMLLSALDDGRLGGDRSVLDSSPGNAGIGYPVGTSSTPRHRSGTGLFSFQRTVIGRSPSQPRNSHSPQ